MPSIADEKYVSLTTYKSDGTPKPLPVWIVDLGDGDVGFTTFSSSYKVKRLSKDPRVVLQPSDQKGKVKPGSEPIEGTATVVDGAEFEAVRAKVKAKYGFQFKIVTFIGNMAKLIGKASGTDRAVVVSLSR